MGRLATELTGSKKERFISFIKNIFKRLKNAVSGINKLEKKFLSLYSTAGQNKNTDNNGVKQMYAGEKTQTADKSAFSVGEDTDTRYMLSEEDNFDSFGNYFDEDENGEVTFISAEQYQDELKKNPKLAVLDKKQIELKAKDFLKRYQSRLDVGEASTELSKVYNYAKIHGVENAQEKAITKSELSRICTQVPILPYK